MKWQNVGVTSHIPFFMHVRRGIRYKKDWPVPPDLNSSPVIILLMYHSALGGGPA